MGVDHYLLFVFEQTPERVEEFLRREFRARFDPDNTDKWTRAEIMYLRRKGILKKSFDLISSGYLWFKQPLQTVRGGFIEGADFKIYLAGWFSVLELHPNPRGWWWDVYSHELMRFLTVFMNGEALLISGYQDDIDLTDLGLEYDNYYFLIDRLVELLGLGELQILPSAFSVIKRGSLGGMTGFMPLKRKIRKNGTPMCS